MSPFTRTNSTTPKPAGMAGFPIGGTNMKAFWDSIVRTVVPIVVGAVIGWAVTAGISLDDQFEITLTLVITGAFQGIYYAAVRLFEIYVSPKFGWLLGLAKQPEYTPIAD